MNNVKSLLGKGLLVTLSLLYAAVYVTVRLACHIIHIPFEKLENRAEEIVCDAIERYDR